MTSQGSSAVSETSSTTLYVHVYPSPLFAAHWSFFLPRHGNILPEVGDRIHATGDRLNGFEYEYTIDYDPKMDSRNPNAFPIGRIATSALAATEDDKSYRNGFDRVCRHVPVPGPSLNPAAAGGGAPRRRGVRDCQWWIKQAVVRLAEEGMIVAMDAASPGEDPISRVDQLPEH